MTYRLSLAVDSNICLELEEEVFPDLLDLFEKMGGDKDWLVNAAKSSVARSLHGDHVGNVVRSMNGTVIEDESMEADSPVAPSEGTTNAGTRTARPSKAEPADPWATDDNPDKDWPGEASTAREAITGTKKTQSKRSGDPWGSNDTDDDPEPPKRPTRSRAEADEDDGPVTTRDKFKREFTVGLPDAPDCDCGEPAARVKAKSKVGKWYTTFKCAKSAPGGDWRSKCDFSEFPD